MARGRTAFSAPPSRMLRAQAQAGNVDAGARRDGRDVHSQPRGRDAGVQGTLRLSRHASARRSTRRSCTAFRRRSACCNDGDISRSTSACGYKGYFTDSATTVAVGEVDATSKRLLDVTRARARGGDRRGACRAITSATSARRCRRWSRARDSAWCAISSVTASARSSTRSRRCRTTASRSAG